MTLHIHYTYKCLECDAFYIPYKRQLSCPKCGNKTDEEIDFIEQAADSAHFNLKENNSYVPNAWYIGSYGDHVLNIIFYLLEGYRKDNKELEFKAFTKEYMDKVGFSDQEYARQHIYEIACLVFEKLKEEKYKK